MRRQDGIEGGGRRIALSDPRALSIRVQVGVDDVDAHDGNVDVEIELADGSTAWRVFMTPQNAATLLARWRATGEAGGGAYLVVEGLVLVPELSEAAIIRAVLAMLDSGELSRR